MKRLLWIFILSLITYSIMAQDKIVQTAGRNALGEFAQKMFSSGTS